MGTVKARFPSKESVGAVAINLLAIMVGALLVALSLNVLLLPYGLLTGGVSGLAMVLFYLLKVPVFLSILLLNIPILWWGAREVNRRFLYYSLAGTLALTILLPLTENLEVGQHIDLILVAIFGGALNGFGLGLVFRGQGSTGGTDIIAVILRKKKNLGIGEVSFYSNLLVITIAFMYLPLNTGLYSIISMFVTGKVIDVVMTGLNTKKSIIIISNKAVQIGNRIINELHRGVTYFAGVGAYTRAERAVINCVANRFELPRLKSIVSETDPDAFMYISDANEVMGKGFTRDIKPYKQAASGETERKIFGRLKQ